MRKKLCCILMLAILLLNSSIMLIISEAVEAIKTETEGEEQGKVLAEINLTKYENFDTTTENGQGGSKGILVQLNLKTGIEFAKDQEYQAIQRTETNLSLPRIKDYKPSRVEVITQSTQATNGGKNAKYEYHYSTGILSIVAENSDYNQKVDNARDEYEIICIYRSECYTDNQENNFKVQLNTYETLNREEKKIISTSLEENYSCKDTIGGVISVEHKTEDIYDGYIKANTLNNENKYDTKYNEKINIMVSNRDISKKIEIKEISQVSLYEETSIDKEQVLNVLGDNGSIDIIDNDANIVKTINKDSETDENGKIKLAYKNRTKNFIMQLNNIEKEGIIEVENSRVIEPGAEIVDNKISTQVDIKGINTITKEVDNGADEKTTETEEIIKYERQEQNETQIKEAISNIDFTLDNNIFANLKPNNTNIILTLRTDSAKYSLFKNPTILIELPKEMKNIDIGTPEIMYDNDIFQVISTDIGLNNDGNKIISIKIQGEQTSYNQLSFIKGVNIIIPVTIELSKKLDNTTQNMKYTYSNEMTGTIENKENEVTLLNKIVNDYSNLNQSDSDNEKIEIKEITVTKDIAAGNKKDIYEKQVQKITLTVKNNTNSEVSNINLQDEIPAEFIYVSTIEDQGYVNNYIDNEQVTCFEKKIDNLKPNETAKFEYYIRVKQNQEIQEKIVSSKAKATIDGNTNIFESNVIENKIKESKFQIDMIAATNKDGLYTAGTKINYKIVVRNITNETLTGVTITSVIPEEATFYESLYLKYDENAQCYVRIYSEEYINKNYDEDNKTVTWNIGTLEAGKEIGVLVAISLNEISDNSDTRTVVTTASVKADNTQEHNSNKEEIIEVNKGTCQVKLTTDLKDKYVYEGSKFNYIVNITNTGKISVDNAIMIDELPKGITGIQVDYGIQGEVEQTLNISNEANVSFSLKPNEVFTAKILVSADELDEGLEKLEVKNLIKVSSNFINEMTSNEVVNVVLKKSENSTEEPDDPAIPESPSTSPDNSTNSGVSQGGYSISGLVWLDDNKNGSRDNSEKVMTKIKVNLYYENGEILKSSTGEDGKYTFTNLKKGKYIVAFLYDNKQYTTTEYQKNGINENINSDARETSIEENGEDVIVGLTDSIELINTDALNIDMGLIENGVFDLKLDKSICRVIVQNNKKTKTYEFENKKSKVSKIEIDRKTANSTNVVVEYKITVTNEGEIAGYAQEIIDYKPKEMDFKSELNSEWYLIDDKLMNTSLSDILIQPGETATLTLVLTKKLTENDFKTVINTAEISKDYNEKLIYDIDSVPGNEQENEDDMSTVSLIIGVGTGEAITYMTFFIMIISVIGVGIYFIKKNIL